MVRVIDAARPTWIIGENVAGIIGVELENVLSSLEFYGYKVQCFIIPACAVGLPHRRNRVFIVAHTMRLRLQTTIQEYEKGSELFFENKGEYTLSELLDNLRYDIQRGDENLRIDNGVPNWVDRIRSIGNSVNPQIVEIIGRAIMQAETFNVKGE